MKPIVKLFLGVLLLLVCLLGLMFVAIKVHAGEAPPTGASTAGTIMPSAEDMIVFIESRMMVIEDEHKRLTSAREYFKAMVAKADTPADAKAKAVSPGGAK